MEEATKVGSVGTGMQSQIVQSATMITTQVNTAFSQLWELAAAFEPLTDQLRSAIQQKFLTERQRDNIRMRYDILADISKSAESYNAHWIPRKTFSRPESVTKQTRTDWTPILMLATLILSPVATVPTFVQGYRMSKGSRGKTDDAGFWFLLQNCLALFLGILTLGLPLSQNRILCTSIKIAAWNPIAIATGCVIVAPFLYLWGSTAWGVFFAMGAGICQAWLVVQLAIEARYLNKDRDINLNTK